MLYSVMSVGLEVFVFHVIVMGITSGLNDKDENSYDSLCISPDSASKLLTLRNAVLHEVRPVATMDPLIIGQARSAGLIFGFTVGAQGVIGLTCAIGVDAKRILTDSITQRSHCKEQMRW
ncbi:hypothetical protein E2C01_028882 [Portunus trituberculatus]|uniref:Uncharacterized protein n=1 Tax=Portunus trituberculatus TaxID=210409 RepID=A0A5B7EQQ0_PORTR|nr:hypothetical protein [Portunus trituberculatus]